ncbi:MAG TPA: glycosyltransferase [Candidatus Dormibacteraeota bacterium]|nr:glycosyltransferase [Candidatus Dormibacteraeota bacterium]
MTPAALPSTGRRPRLLLYAMYDPAGLDSAPKVRISMMADALEDLVELERIQGTRMTRARAALRWLRRPGIGSVDAVYVESSTSSATPVDLAFLLWARLRGRPVGVYFRDAYQLFRRLYPVTRWRHRLADLAWRVSMPVLRRIATVRFAPTLGLAEVLGLDDAVMLPPGTDPALPDTGVGSEPVVAYVGATNVADGYDRLFAAVCSLREGGLPETRLLVVAPSMPSPPAAFVDHVRSARPHLADVLRPARVCVIPRPVNAYTDVALPVKLMDYLAMGKPVVATDARETRRVVEASGAGSIVGDTPEAIALGLRRILEDAALAASMSARARSFATRPENTWPARARTVVASLTGVAP